MHVSHALPNEFAPAFELIFRHLPIDEKRLRVRHALDLIHTGDLDGRGVFVLPGKGGLRGAMLCSVVAGGGSLVWPPGVVEGPEARDSENHLITRALTWLRERGASLSQCLVHPSELRLTASLLRNGFRHVTSLPYLQHDLALSPRLLSHPSRLAFESYRTAAPEEFHQTLLGTYEGTLDCPEVSGVRTIDQVIGGHQVQGRFDPATWWLARIEGEPVGVLLLNEQEGGESEVAYMGIVPAFRQRGLGKDLLLHALCEAKALGACRVILTVDERNSPAKRLYHSVGFSEYDRREVLLCLWR